MSAPVRCPVCEHEAGRVFLARDDVPVHQNLLLASREAAVGVRRGALRLACCERCGFVFNAAFDHERLEYGAAYDNTQDCSPLFAAYLDELAAHITKGREGTVRVVEVGCGKGTFLRRLVEAGNGRVVGHGFDPTYEGPLEDAGGRLRFTRSFYNADSASVPADVVVCRHVIEHVDRPLDLLGTIRTALAASPDARLFLETPCVEWILSNGAAWDFFYEHCSYFAPSSLRTALARSGFSATSVAHAFGGQYLWAEAVPAEVSDPTPDQVTVPTSLWEDEHVAAVRERISKLAETRTLALWGAGAKGVTFANLLDSDGQLFACVVDLNPRKQGRHIAGTGHRIVDYRELPVLGVDTCLLMNPVYADETHRLLDTLESRIELLDVGGTESAS